MCEGDFAGIIFHFLGSCNLQQIDPYHHQAPLFSSTITFFGQSTRILAVVRRSEEDGQGSTITFL